MNDIDIDKIQHKIENGEYQAAIDLCNTLLVNKDEEWILYSMRGKAMEKSGDLSGALSDFNRAVQLNPNSSTSYFYLAKVHAALGNDTLAIENYSKSYVLSQKNDSLYNRALAYARIGEMSKAIDDFIALSKDDDLDAETLEYAASLCSKADRYDEAKQLLLKALELVPESDEICYNLGVVHENLKEVSQAIVFYKRCLQVNPTHEDAIHNLKPLTR